MLKKKIGLAMATTALGATLVAGGSFALFTDTAANNGNTFAAGTVEISLDRPNDGEHQYFDIENIAPGDSGSSMVKVKNDGSLDLRYDVTKTLTGELVGANGLEVSITDKDGMAISLSDRVLEPGASEDLKVSWSLPLTAGDEYQGRGAMLDLSVAAEQTKNNP